MSPAGRPWWYSGDDESDVEAADFASAPAPEPEPGPEPVKDNPSTGSPTSENEQAPGEASGIEWTALLAGAQRMMDWATERVMAPHAEHDVPADHPQCVVCRTMVLIGEGRSPVAEETTESSSADGRDQADDVVDGAARVRDRQIAWIPIRPGAGEP